MYKENLVEQKRKGPWTNSCVYIQGLSRKLLQVAALLTWTALRVSNSLQFQQVIPLLSHTWVCHHRWELVFLLSQLSTHDLSSVDSDFFLMLIIVLMTGHAEMSLDEFPSTYLEERHMLSELQGLHCQRLY